MIYNAHVLLSINLKRGGQPIFKQQNMNINIRSINVKNIVPLLIYNLRDRVRE